MKNSLILSLFVLLLAALPAHTGAATPGCRYFCRQPDTSTPLWQQASPFPATIML